MVTNTHIECVGDPGFKAVGSWDDGTPTSGTAIAGAGILTLDAFHGGTCTATMGFTIIDDESLYFWELWVDEVTLGGGTLTVTAGGKTIKVITVAGKFSGTIEPDSTTALTVVTATAAVTAAIQRISLVKYGHGRNPT
jgi:hypothetical protein